MYLHTFLIQFFLSIFFFDVRFWLDFWFHFDFWFWFDIVWEPNVINEIQKIIVIIMNHKIFTFSILKVKFIRFLVLLDFQLWFDVVWDLNIFNKIQNFDIIMHYTGFLTFDSSLANIALRFFIHIEVHIRAVFFNMPFFFPNIFQ